MNLNRVKQIKNNKIGFKMPYTQDDVDTINSAAQYKKEYIVNLCIRDKVDISNQNRLIYEFHKENKGYTRSAETFFNTIFKEFTYNQKQIYLEKSRIYLLNSYGVIRVPSIHDNKDKEIGDIGYDCYNFPYYWDGEEYKKIKYFSDVLER